jgi:riboflavin kinase/FMN adenylyltransferase
MSGDLKRAKRLLGRPISVFGTVIKGARFARVLGYPTANINPHHEVIPPAGVYAVKVRIGNTVKGGILNVGIRPTFYGPRDREPSIEAHIFDFKSSIYGKEIEVYFIKKIRDEITFEDAGALTAQIEKDRTLALQICKNMIICPK